MPACAVHACACTADKTLVHRGVHEVPSHPGVETKACGWLDNGQIIPRQDDDTVGELLDKGLRTALGTEEVKTPLKAVEGRAPWSHGNSNPDSQSGSRGRRRTRA